MASRFPSASIVDIAAPIPNATAAGPFGSNLVSGDYTESGIPVIRGQNLLGRWVGGAFVFVSPAKASALRTNTARPGDIVFTQRGTLGQVAIVPDAAFPLYVISQSQMKLTIDRTKADGRYVYYACCAEQFVRQVIDNAVAAGVPHINLGLLRSLTIPLPELQEQQSISSLLGALDDRVDLLRQTNATLEGMAKALFRCWFVDFDAVRAKAEGREPEGMDASTAALFPSELDESDLGLIPRGWRVGRLGELCQNVRMQAKPNSMKPTTPYIGLEHMPRGSIALTKAGIADGLASGKFWYTRYDVLFGKLRPYFHKVGVSSHTGVCSTDILVVRANEPTWFAYTTMHLSSEALIAYATRLSNGAKMPRSNWSDIAGYQVAIPPAPVASAFDSLARTLIDRIHANIDQSRVLADLRDALLPRLITGKLRLPEAEILIKEATA